MSSAWRLSANLPHKRARRLAATAGWFLYRNLYRQALGEMVFETALADKFLELLTGSILTQEVTP